MVVAAATARLSMSILGTSLIDRVTADVGVGVAALCGAVVCVILHAGRRRLTWAIVPVAGACIGMFLQLLLLLNRPSYRLYVIASGIDSKHPVAWVLAGAPFGALPALVAGALLFLALRKRTLSLDDRQRMLSPLVVGGTLLFLGAMPYVHDIADAAVTVGFIALGVLAMVQILRADERWSSWLASVFASRLVDVSLHAFAEVPVGTPLAIAGTSPALVVHGPPGASLASVYRSSARTALCLVAADLEQTLVPLRRRQRLLRATIPAVVAALVGGGLYAFVMSFQL